MLSNISQNLKTDYSKIWEKTKQQMQKSGCTFYNLEKTRDHYKNGTVTYQNIKCEYWTAAIVKGELTDIMIKADSEQTARENQSRWESFLN